MKGALLPLLSMGCATGQPASEGAAVSTEAPSERSGPLRADQILEILERSPLMYSIVSPAEIDRTGVARMVDGPTPRTDAMGAYVVRERTQDSGQLRIRQNRPPKDIAPLFTAADEAYAKRDFETASWLYGEAIRMRPDYFKSYTYLGNALSLLGAYRDAETAFHRALELNPIDYQALLFLGDTYYQLGDYSQAKSVLTRAFMLNRNNEAVQNRLEVTLAKMDLHLRDRRLTPRVHITQTESKTIEIQLAEASDIRWMALATCMACWAFESDCKDRKREEEDPLRLAMYRECLVNQAITIAYRRDKGGTPVPSDEKALLGAIEDGLLDAIILWEVVAEVAPLVILLLPEELQEDILRYIERYVFQSTQVI